MQRVIFTALVVLLVLVGGCSKAPIPPEPEVKYPELGFLNISTVDDQGTKIDSVRIYFNGDFIGFTPIVIDSVPFGIHTIRTQKQGYEVYSENLAIDNSFPVHKEIIIQKLPINAGQLLVTVNQDSARTTVTNPIDEIIEQSYARELLLTLKTGGYFIRCEKPGYELILKAVEVKIDSITIENIKLQELPDQRVPQIVLAVPDSGVVNTPILISWESMNAKQVDIDYIENPGLFGKREVAFQSTGKHYIRAIARNQSDQQCVVIDSIYIYQMSNLPPEITLSLDTPKIKLGEIVTISWNSKNANKIAVDYVPNPGLSGKWQERFYSSGDIIINAYAYGPGGSAQDSDTLYVEESRAAPTIQVTVSPRVVTVNEKITIQWSSTNAIKVDVDFVPNPGLSGKWQTQFPSVGEIVVNAYAYGNGQKAQDADTIRIMAAHNPTLGFLVTPEVVEFSAPVHLSWNSDGYKVIIDHGIGTRGPTGKEEIVFQNPGLKIITAVAYGQNNLITIQKDSVLVEEPEVPALPILNLSVVDSVEVGQPAQIEWHSWNATAVDVDYVQNPGLNGKAELIFHFPGERLITATAYNNDGQITVSEKLIVVNITVKPPVEDVIVPSGAFVCAESPNCPSVIENAGKAQIEVPGYYHVIAAGFFNSGDDQANESFFITFVDAQGIEHTPIDPNAGSYKVIPDDPGPPHVAEKDAGTFYLNQGENTVRLSHYYVIANQFPNFVNGRIVTGVQSVQLLYLKLEYVTGEMILDQ